MEEGDGAKQRGVWSLRNLALMFAETVQARLAKLLSHILPPHLFILCDSLDGFGHFWSQITVRERARY